MKRSSSLKSFWTSEREWDTQQGLLGSKPMPSHRTVKRTFSGVLQLPRLSRRLSAQGDSENFTRKASFSLGIANGLESDTYQSSWNSAVMSDVLSESPEEERPQRPTHLKLRVSSPTGSPKMSPRDSPRSSPRNSPLLFRRLMMNRSIALQRRFTLAHTPRLFGQYQQPEFKRLQQPSYSLILASPAGCFRPEFSFRALDSENGTRRLDGTAHSLEHLMGL
ncbi:hypothetical protein QQF64_014912 [Cirrhinus molitorella]|uniref:Uncharacterized protein n=1 Tax=Cirrhinus molitorella TaxID=172907 RepID=A0ABR3NTY0_9TELE